MKRFLLGAAAATLLMTGCAQNELIDGGIATPKDGRIYFSATSGVPTTKAAAGNPINSTGDLQDKVKKFSVVGFAGTTEYVGSIVTPQEVSWNGVSWEYPNEPYWPSTGSMDFMAYANWPATTDIPNPTITATGMSAAVKIGPDATTPHQDLLVAATYGATKETRTLLTFKHALTQIVFKAGNLSETGRPDALDVYIGGIKIVKVADAGTMTVSADATNNGLAKIDWTGHSAQTSSFAVNHIDLTNPTKADGAFEVSRIAPTSQTDYKLYKQIQTAAEPANNALMLVPQTFDAWNPNSGVMANAQAGAYIEIDAIIRKEGSTDASTWFCGTYNTNLDDADYGKIYIPIESLDLQAAKWAPGKRINYIITFGDKNSGSGGGGYDNNGDPILVPIRFRAIVEDWVETNVPLLTATFETNSNAITHKFIDSYTNQLLSDIKAAAAPKVYKSSIKFTGLTSVNIGGAGDWASSNMLTGLPANTSFQNLLGGFGSRTFQNAKFLPGSTLTYDLTGVTNLSTNNAKINVPTGWIGQTMSGTAVSTTVLPAGSTVTLNKTTVDGLKLTKVATTGYCYLTQVGYIEDNLAAIELNENNVAAPAPFDNTVTVLGTLPGSATRYVFSSDMLSKFVSNAYTGSKVTVDMDKITPAIFGTKSIVTWCPVGWSALAGGKTYFPGDAIVVDKNTLPNHLIVFTKQASLISNNYVGAASLDLWLKDTNVKAAGATFYYDNVGFDVAIDLTKAPWANILDASVTTTAVVKLKYPLSAGQVTGTGTGAGTWSYSAGTLTYTK